MPVATHRRFAPRGVRVVLATGLIALTCLTVEPSANAVVKRGTLFPVGMVNRSEPSGLAPPSVKALPGYRRTYVEDFNGPSIPHGWSLFNGVPGGDPTGRFSPQHVSVAKGLLRLNVYQDPSFANQWVTGGMCQCQRPMTYGAYFVRSRVTGLGANTAELLWPSGNTWPPEIDFNENLFHLNLTTATTHWTSHTDFRILKINMLKWHTWGVVWTPDYLLYLVDGRPWHEFSVASGVPHVPMVLDFEQRTTCPSGLTCPTHSSALLIDWVAEFQKTP